MPVRSILMLFVINELVEQSFDVSSTSHDLSVKSTITVDRTSSRFQLTRPLTVRAHSRDRDTFHSIQI